MKALGIVLLFVGLSILISPVGAIAVGILWLGAHLALSNKDA